MDARTASIAFVLICAILLILYYVHTFGNIKETFVFTEPSLEHGPIARDPSLKKEPKGQLHNMEYPDGPTPQSYTWKQPVGYNWTLQWRPYFWRNFPDPPIWFPSRSPAADQPALPHDKKMLEMMERPCQSDDLACRGISPQGYNYFWKIEQPYQPLCADYADYACRDQPYPHFCYRRTYGKCIDGLL